MNYLFQILVISLFFGACATDEKTDAGIAPEMGVITGHGIIGIVKEVSAHYSTVISFLNTQSKVSVRFKKNNYFGSMFWDSDYGPTEASVIVMPFLFSSSL